MRRTAFTLIELLFVIVIMGILSKFGVEFLAQAYNNFISSNINNTLQAQSEAAVETIASRLQYRIKDSIIAKKANGDFKALASSDYGASATILEWIGSDIDGFRGNSLPMWSGVIDLNNSISSSTLLVSPETNTTALNTLIDVLSNGGSDINDSAIYFVGSDTNIRTGYGWDTNLIAIDAQSGAMHPVKAGVNINEFVPIKGSDGTLNNFNGVDVYEYYQFAWSAYAVVHSADGNLTMYYDYQPWKGQSYTSGKHATLMENVDTFRFKAIGSIVKIQVCVNSSVMEDYSLCKEKTIY